MAARSQLSRSDLLAAAWEPSTLERYRYALGAYQRFLADTGRPPGLALAHLEAYVVWLSNRYVPATVRNYLSGLRHHFALSGDVGAFDRLRSSWSIRMLLRGGRKLDAQSGRAIKRAPALSQNQLAVCRAQLLLDQFDDALFWSMTLAAVFGLLRLGELVNPDAHRVPPRSSLVFERGCAFFKLPYAKTDTFFESSTITLSPSRGRLASLCPVYAINQFVRLRDRSRPPSPRLFVHSDGSAPTRSWLVARLRDLLDDASITGHSLRATGATLMATSGASQLEIMRAGRWASDAFLRYLRKHPDVERALISESHSLVSPSASADWSASPHPSGATPRA
jgi:hypothetical protein